MDCIHDRNSNILFSLHDSRVNKIKYHNNTLTLKVHKIFQFVDDEEKAYPGEICFKDCDVDLCNVLIFNKTLREGPLNGKSICLHQIMDEYSGLDFEIITEGYFGNTTTYTVWLWENGKAPVSAIMYIWNSGDMVYRVEK